MGWVFVQARFSVGLGCGGLVWVLESGWACSGVDSGGLLTGVGLGLGWFVGLDGRWKREVCVEGLLFLSQRRLRQATKGQNHRSEQIMPLLRQATQPTI